MALPTWVLFVEDDHDLCDAVSEKLGADHIKTAIANDPRQAAAKLENQKFDLILLDMTLGKSSGLEVIESARNPKSPNKQTPIMVASGTLDKALLAEIGNRVNQIIVKPYRLEDLLTQVNRLLGRQNS